MELIYAEATPPGRGGVSVVRLSGENARKVAEDLTGRLEEARKVYLRSVMDGDELLDEGLVMRFDEGNSFTGEPVVELHLHGAPVVVRRVCAALAFRGAREAEAGEFTRRAFLSGRINLSEVEGLGDLLEAETEAQRKLAARSVSGEMGKLVERWRSALIRAGALVEASVDFADEEVPDEVPSEVYDILYDLKDQFDSEILGFQAAERLRMGFEVAVIGPPNAGKSSLINRIAKRDVALVSQTAGTTRDIIEVQLDLKGLAVTLLDTAGLRETNDAIEEMGVDRARQRASFADLRLHLSDTNEVDSLLWQDGDIRVRTKSDLGTKVSDTIAISSVTGSGVDNLLDMIYANLSTRVAGAGLISHERQKRELTDARDAIEDVRSLPPELLAEAIRLAAVSLSRLLGRIGSEEYLDTIFSSFCIGK